MSEQVKEKTLLLPNIDLKAWFEFGFRAGETSFSLYFDFPFLLDPIVEQWSNNGSLPQVHLLLQSEQPFPGQKMRNNDLGPPSNLTWL